MIQFISICLHIDWKNEKLVMREREYMNILKLSSHEISQIFIYFSEPVLFVLICNGTWRIVIFVKSNDDVTVIDSCWFWFCFVRSRKELHITRMKTICLLEICGENKMRRDAYSNTFECNIFEIVLLLSFKYITFKEKYFHFITQKSEIKFYHIW